MKGNKNQLMTVDFNLLPFLLAIASPVFAVFAIFQPRSNRNESKETFKRTRSLLEEIKVHSVIISQYALPEPRAYGESIRAHLFQQRSVRDLEAVKRDAEAVSVGTPTAAQKNIRNDITQEIVFLAEHTGRALSLELFERLKHKFDFGTVLTELLVMHKAGLVSWPEAPNPPDALSIIELTKK